MMKTTARIAALLLALLPVTGCSGRAQETSDTRPLRTDAASESSFADNDTVMLPVTGTAHSHIAEETELLVRLVASEAGEYPYMSQVCLAAMVLNRTEDPAFPDSLSEVIKDSKSFSHYTTEGSTEDKDKLKIAKRAVLEALSGVDPTGGALYFCPSNKIRESYVIPTFECGGLVFGK